jgi:hypothetical protein
MSAEDDNLKTSSQQSDTNHNNNLITKHNNRGAHVMRSMALDPTGAISPDDKFFRVPPMQRDGGQEQDDD